MDAGAGRKYPAERGGPGRTRLNRREEPTGRDGPEREGRGSNSRGGAIRARGRGQAGGRGSSWRAGPGRRAGRAGPKGWAGAGGPVSSGRGWAEGEGRTRPDRTGPNRTGGRCRMVGAEPNSRGEPGAR